jgi:hypothetical protein
VRRRRRRRPDDHHAGAATPTSLGEGKPVALVR